MEKIVLDFIEEKFGKRFDVNTPIREFCEDSIMTVEFLFEIEQRLNKKISESNLYEIETIQDLINFFK